MAPSHLLPTAWSSRVMGDAVRLMGERLWGQSYLPPHELGPVSRPMRKNRKVETSIPNLVLWFLPWRCLRARWAILMPGIRRSFPFGWTAWSLAKIFPVSVVKVVRTSSPPRVRSPTFDSGLERSLDWVTRPTASWRACSRVGKKSPLRMYSELSMLEKTGMDLKLQESCHSREAA